MKSFILMLFEDLLNLFFPNCCAACGEYLVKGESAICTGCQLQMPVTEYENDPENPVIKQFWGKVPVLAASAYCHFSKGGRIQRLIHQLKYDSRPDIGVRLGHLYGHRLMKHALYFNADLIIPIPLHPGKEMARGYNQAACFAQGLSEAMKIPHHPRALRRNRNTATQTRKSRFDRALNVDSVFEAEQPELLHNKRILLVDDVITTGSTLVSAVETLQRIPGTEVIVLTIAYARH